MKTHSEAIDPFPDEGNFDHVIKAWLDASISLHECYTQLVTHVSEEASSYPLAEALYVGQCPKRQIAALLHRMQGELERLIQDLDQLEGLHQLPAKRDYRKLATHTRRLNKLNHQAQTRLHLISQPTS